jgi:hypothetical protein
VLIRLSPFSGASFSQQNAYARRDSLFQFFNEKCGLEVRQDFAGSEKISPLMGGMPLHSQHGETQKTLTHGIADAF